MDTYLDRLYFTDVSNRKVRVVDRSTGLISTVAGNGPGPGDGAQTRTTALAWQQKQKGAGEGESEQRCPPSLSPLTPKKLG